MSLTGPPKVPALAESGKIFSGDLEPAEAPISPH